MENQQQEQLTPLGSDQVKEIQGGALWTGLLLEGIGLLIAEWETTKQAAKDAWNGTYNPPQ